MFSQEQVDKALEMYRRGDRMTDITATIGCNNNTVTKWARAAGIPSRFGTKNPNLQRGPRDRTRKGRRTEYEIRNRIAALQAQLVDPATKKSAYGIIVGRIEELEWVLSG